MGTLDKGVSDGGKRSVARKTKKARTPKRTKANKTSQPLEGARNHSRLTKAAKMRAEGIEWSVIAADLGVSESTVRKYTGHWSWAAAYTTSLNESLANLEDSLYIPALKRNRQIIDSEDEHVAVKAIALAYSRRDRREEQLDKHLNKLKEHEEKQAGTSTVQTIQIGNDIQEPSETTNTSQGS